MRFSIIICCYNTLTLLKETLKNVLNTTDNHAEILLVNNHPPYPNVKSFLRRFKHPRVKVLDPGHNLGCTQGFQYGFRRAQGEYLIKLDDDTIVPDTNWSRAMFQALCDFSELAYVGLTVPIYPIGKYPWQKRSTYTLEISEDLVHFACIMIKKQLWQQHFQIPNNDRTLYGNDESFFMAKAQNLGLKKGYLVSHQCQHLARNHQSDPLYGVWKIFYLAKHTTADFNLWRQTAKLGPTERSILAAFQYPASEIRLVEKLI